ncbi:hypothetical protein ElyMa_005450800 [Elysia marginata]|uniref:Uncharacterized protein n=1 Tax=Elysia marginata TaxID=1093978 RepID=A0AAV4EN15_9GAST|nr:hypothetical protein ElyMa_005450800 [Elysia marginata]
MKRFPNPSALTLYYWFAQLVICSLITHTVVSKDFPLIGQCQKKETGASLTGDNLNFCLELGSGLLPTFPSSICHNPSDVIVIHSFQLLTPRMSADPLFCHQADIDGFNYHDAVNSTCLQTHGYSRQVKNAILPLMRLYNGKTSEQILAADSNQYIRQLGPDGKELVDFTWYSLPKTCVDKRTTASLLNADICANLEQRGTNIVHIQFLPHGGVYVNQTSCSCNIFSASTSVNPKDRTLTARALDIRLADSSAVLHLNGKGGSRTLDGSEILYWSGDGNILTSEDQLFLKLDRLNLRALPERMWLEVRGANLTVNCGPADQPGGHQPLAAESKSLGLVYIIAIIVGVVILLVLLLILVKCVYQRKRRRGGKKDEDDEYNISMNSNEDIRDRYKLHALRQQMSTDSGVEPAVEIKTEAEVMCSNPRMVPSPVAEADESQRALLPHEEEEDDGSSANNNTTAKKPLFPPPPPPHDPHNHEFFICRQLSYIDEDETALPPPPPAEEIFNHLNDHQRPDVVPGNIYDTKPVEENHYSTTQPKKKRAPHVPLPEDHYVT